MTDFDDDLTQSLQEAVAHAKGERPALVHVPADPREVRQRVGFTQTEMAAIMGMSVSGYRKWEQNRREVSGPANVLLHVIDREPDAVRRALTSA